MMMAHRMNPQQMMMEKKDDLVVRFVQLGDGCSCWSLWMKQASFPCLRYCNQLMNAIDVVVEELNRWIQI